MSNQLIISVSGLRGIVGESLTPNVAYRYANAFATSLPEGPVLVSRDGRANGPALVAPVVAGLSQGGARAVLDAGIVATPTTGVLVQRHCCMGGIQISASHNPAEYNGLKLFSAEGRVVPASVGQRVLTWFNDGNSNLQEESHRAAAHVTGLADTVSDHLALIERIVDVERIRARRFRVLLDANHGAGSVLGRPLLERLNCDVVLIGGTPDGHFAHPPEPTAENLSDVGNVLTSAGAQIGFCQDPDADRLAIIDEQGHYVGEEYTLAVCVDHVLSQTRGPVVTNCSTSRMTEDIAGKHGVPYFRSAVGEANVVDAMLKHNAIIGGEGNGGAIDPRVVLVRDSFVGMALVLDAMAARNCTFSELVGALPRYAIRKSKVNLSRARVAASLDRLERHFTNGTPDRLDGLRLDFADKSWLLIRASNTEPIARIIAEAPTDEAAARLCEEAAQVVDGGTPA